MMNRRGMCCSLAVLAMACCGIELQADDAPYQLQPYRRVERLPPVSALNPPSWRGYHRGPARHGTWQQDGDEMVINLNGQQYRLEKIGEDRPVSGNSATPSHRGGEVRGRLSHRGKPLADCTVTLMRLKKSFGGYTVSRDTEPLTTVTNLDGSYQFAEVAPGHYKLRWRPHGETHWIRRAEFRPDVRVRTGETSRIKEIRVALRTLN
ncbi:MAG: carboxypeptidase regulatory-like domain-containing protein [Planctomycetes bacterium]|nr:carboxypeptidase regulatory-like domain-containing protein [Planctomycetota bacterium]